MPTLLQSIDNLIDKISVTDRQEENIKNSTDNLSSYLKDKESGLFVKEVFTNGSWERDTIIRPLDDVDLFAVLDRDKWKDEYGQLPNPQSVLSKMRNYLNSISDYKDKVKQDRPCVTVKLSDKDFDVLPSFAQMGGGYQIPNYDLNSWTFSYPEQLSKNLDDVHRYRGYKVKPIIKAIKYWNRENGKIIPSYHIEEAAISIFWLNSFANFEEGIRKWFDNAEMYVQAQKFKSNDEYLQIMSKVKKVKTQLNDAYKKYTEGKEGEAIQIWKNVFGKEFPTVDVEEAKSIGKALSEGALKYSTAGISTTVGKTVSASKGFFGHVSGEEKV